MRAKVREMLPELRADKWSPSLETMEAAIKGEYADAHEIAFHLSDWYEDAAFIVAVKMHPERFTPEEIAAGVEAFLTHAPNHVAAAAKLSGWPIKDVFKVGPLLDDGS